MLKIAWIIMKTSQYLLLLSRFYLCSLKNTEKVNKVSRDLVSAVSFLLSSFSLIAKMIHQNLHSQNHPKSLPSLLFSLWCGRQPIIRRQRGEYRRTQEAQGEGGTFSGYIVRNCSTYGILLSAKQYMSQRTQSKAVKKHGIRSQTPRVQILALLLTSSMILGKFLNLCGLVSSFIK